MTDIEARFEQDMVEKVYRAAGRETGYWAGYFLRSVKRYGGVGAARRLLERSGVSPGLARLAGLNRLDLAMETLVLDPAYGLLFTDEERAVATRRLEQARAATPLAPGEEAAGVTAVAERHGFAGPRSVGGMGGPSRAPHVS